MASFAYDRMTYNLATKKVNLSTDTIRFALMSAGYTPSQSHKTWASISAYETAGTGYTSKGYTLLGKTVTENNTSHKMVWDASNPTWTGATFSARYGVMVDNTATSNLLALADFGTTATVASGTFTVQFSAGGILTIG